MINGSNLNTSTNRNRYIYILLIGITIAAGLASRRYAHTLPQWAELYMGDALWALMVYFIFGFLFNKKSAMVIALLAIGFSFGIEISQLYHAAWIDAIRATRIGGLVLGFGFLWSDLLCYTVGVSVGVGIEWVIGLKKVS